LQEAGIKKKKLEREELGLNLYDLEQNVMKQQGLIDNCHDTIATITKTRQEMEAQVEACRNTYKSEKEKLNNAQKKGQILLESKGRVSSHPSAVTSHDLLYYFTLKMEASRSSKTLVSYRNTICCHNL